MLALRERGVFVKQEKKKIVILIKKKLLFREKASFTVEASLIMMTVLMAVFMCIYYGFFTHDKAVLEEVSWHTAQKAMLLVTENSSMKDGAFSWEELQEKGLLWRISQNTANQDIICEYANTHIEGELFACDMPSFLVFGLKDFVLGSVCFSFICILSCLMGQKKIVLKYIVFYVVIAAIQQLCIYLPQAIETILSIFTLFIRVMIPVVLFASTFIATTKVSELIGHPQPKRERHILLPSFSTAAT